MQNDESLISRFCILHFAFCILLLASCATTTHSESPIAPLAPDPNPLQQLSARRASLAGARSLMRVRAGQQSFKALLRVQGDRMELTVYTPLNTSAATLYAEGDRVTFLDHLNLTQWQGSAGELAGALRIFATRVRPSDLALLLLGFPAGGSYDAKATGLASATIGDITVAFDPPSLPAQHVVVTCGQQRIELQHLETIETGEPLHSPRIPHDYKPGGVPTL
jgi:hypothetical protein